MNLREVTVGRDRDCDIYLDQRCIYASSHHGRIYVDGGQLMFRDTSSNGTMINNVSVKHRAVPIHHGDIIMIAGQYQLNWNQIDALFNFAPNQQRTMGTIIDNNIGSHVEQNPTVDTSKWCWGAFSLYPIWGFFNGCWWAILIWFFLGWLYPIPNIIMGIGGSKWAWDNGTWQNIHEYQRTQTKWNKFGLVFACIQLAIVIFVVCFYSALIMSVL